MTPLPDRIRTMISSDTRDLEQIERTLTDGYAEALAIEAEKWRLERRMTEITQRIHRGDTAENARELATLARRREGSEGALKQLRAILADLRRHADGVRTRTT